MQLEEQITVSEMQSKINLVSQYLNEAKGEQRAISARKDQLTEDVGLAKGRLDRRKDVERFIEDMQAEAHAKRVGDFERLLSALVSEVLPGEKPIGLDLDIGRGQPSLDIVSRISSEITEDIFEDQGGALTNIVVLGLRMIAVVRSGMRRFLVLDEPDCWVKNDRISAFYSVVKEAARKVGVQCFVISHHETSQFNEGISVSKIQGHPEDNNGARVENNPRPYRWSDEEDGFRYIRLINFQGYKDETLYLHAGVNALIGENNTGKSSFVRAFRAVFYADVRDSLIRRGLKQCTVEIGLKGGQILQWTRTRRKNSNWKLLNADRMVATPEFDTTSRNVPEWVSDKIGIGPIAGLDPHIIKQKLPVFLLDKPGSTRAAVLSIGQEASHIRDMIKTYKKMCDEDNAIVKNGEIEMARLIERESKLKPMIMFEDKLQNMERALQTIVKNTKQNEHIEGTIQKIEFLEKKNENIAAALLTLKKLDKNLPKLISSDEIIKTAKKIRELQDRNAHLGKLISIMDNIPKELPSLKINQELETVISKIERITERNNRLKKTLDTVGKLAKFKELPKIISSSELIETGRKIKELTDRNKKLEAFIKIAERLPKNIPSIKTSSDLNKIIEDIESKQQKQSELQKDINEKHKLLEQSKSELIEKIDAIGNMCPLCGNEISEENILTHGALQS